jgi:serine/threonine protein phosphatase 1
MSLAHDTRRPAPISFATRKSAAGQLVYAIGDVHGCYDLMKTLLRDIALDAAERADGRQPVLVFLGDYVDRGPHSSKVMEALVWLMRRRDMDIHLLKGNHEKALLDFLDQPERGGPWIGFGGAETLMSYGVQPPKIEGGAEEYRRARDELLERMPASHLRLLQKLELMVMVGDYAFVHAGVRPGAGLERQLEEDLLWIRKGFLDATGPFEKVIVHGHTWVEKGPQLHDHRLGIDTGAYQTGVLTAVRIEDGEVGLMQARR